ncbi:MAG: hypothetical protein O3C49_01425, partial [Proteobacteria bacterium]|nr:hypothetical protein [Pseudomonadota bacterium]
MEFSATALCRHITSFAKGTKSEALRFHFRQGASGSFCHHAKLISDSVAAMRGFWRRRRLRDKERFTFYSP